MPGVNLLTLANMGGGALEELFGIALSEMIEVMIDPNFQNKSGTITAVMKFAPVKDNDEVFDLDFTVTSKLPPRDTHSTQIVIGDVDGVTMAQEFERQPKFNFEKKAEDQEATETPDNVSDINQAAAAQEDAK